MCDMELKMLPVGIENFEEMRTEAYYYVDKTAMIKDLLRRRGKVNLFTRPRRFGKSLNMGMLKCFFEIGCNKSVFDGLNISKEAGLCEKYMGRFPVVSISLKDVNGADYATARALMCAVIGNEAMRFYDLTDSDKVTYEEKELYRQLITVDTTGKGVYAMAEAALMGSLKTLSRLLAKHYGTKAVILIDEYDVPLAKAQEHGYYDRMLLLIGSMLEQSLKTNDSLYFAVLTGCLRVSKESIFTGLNNPKVFSITDQDCDSYFGFTDDEVKEMLSYYKLDDKYHMIKEWYDGYHFGDADVYCPWDVVSYVSRLQAGRSLAPQDYWSNTSGNDVVKKLLHKASPDTRDDIERLIAGESVMKVINEELTYNELYDSIENIWSILFTTGYLTQHGDAEGSRRRLAIPNREIHNIFMNQIKVWMQGKAREDGERLGRFCDAFRSADSQKVQEIFTQYLNETVSIRDTAVWKDQKENFYHGFLLGLLRYKEDWKVMSNRESGRGYADISIEIPAEKMGILIEVKYAEHGNLAAGCRAALKQIEMTDYAEQLYLDGMGRIVKCGMACYVKNCMAVFELDRSSTE